MTDRKFLLFRSTPGGGVDISILGSMEDEEKNQKIIDEQVGRGAEYFGPLLQTQLERVRQARICIALWATAYEFYDHSLVSDAKFDELAKQVERDLAIDTDNKKLDKWFRKNFSADTGQWVYSHPDLNMLKKKAKQLIQFKENKK